MIKRRNYEARMALVNPINKNETVIIYKTYSARSKYEAIGKAIVKLLPSYGGYLLKGISAYFTRQKPI